MPPLAVQITIRDYANWRPVFDKQKSLREKAGFTNTRVYHNADNDKEVIVWSDAIDVAKAREALTGQEISKAMQEVGVVSPPKIHVIV